MTLKDQAERKKMKCPVHGRSRIRGEGDLGKVCVKYKQ